MKTFKIYGDSYELMESVNVAIDGYAYKGGLTDEVPKGKCVGYVTMNDGSIIECYKSFNPVVVIAPLVTVSLLCMATFVYLIYGQPKDVVSTSGAPVKVGTDKNVVSYNGFSAVYENELHIDFQNGEYPSTIVITGDGIESTEITVEPNQYIATVPVTVTTEDGLVDANISISTDTSTTTNPIVVEIPDNTTPDSPSGLEGNWRGEYIYGVQ